jgi:eukaryotic-like serine/threonine-protein kinase
MVEGEKFGRYEIREKIGSGGMGEVFLAQDIELDRPVALKVLPEEFCQDAERVQRFKQEARAASALNHPNIITIYEIGQEDGRIFIATEYINGKTLRQLIENNEISTFDAVHIAEQVASALSVAHQAHIIHRDIKPENIMVREDEYVKILDFGLAKPVLQKTAGAEDKTLQMVQTQSGMVMGSVNYMSPEQARGKEVDQRTDIWSLGVVLYEMISGKNPFAGETVSDSLAALIHIEPEALENFVENVSADLQWIVRKSLEKKVVERYQSIKDLALDLKDLRYQFEHSDIENKTRQINPYLRSGDFEKSDTSENKTLIHHTTSADNALVGATGNVQQPTVNRKRNWALPFGILGFAVVLAFGTWYFKPFSTNFGQPPFDSMQISRLTENGRASRPVISADGKYIVYINIENGLSGLVVRQVATGSNIQIVPPSNLNFQIPEFSPDGSYIYYSQVDNGVGTLYQIPSLGGTPKKIIVDVDSKISFSPDGKRFAFIRYDLEKNTSNIYLANSDGSNAEILISTEGTNEKRFVELAWSPNNEDILVAAPTKISRDDLVETKLLLVSLKDKKLRQLGEKTWLSASSFNWANDNGGVYFTAKTGETEPKQIWFVGYKTGNYKQITSDSSGYATMSLAANNTIVASKVDLISSIWSFNPQNKEMAQITSESKNLQGFGGISQMPDGRLLFAKTEGNNGNLVVIDGDGKNETNLIAIGGTNAHPSLSPDGKFIVFCSNKDGFWQIWRADSDGKNPLKLSKTEGFGDIRPIVLADNKTIVFERKLDELFRSKLMKVSIESGQEEALFPENQTSDSFPKLSPDGKHLSYIAQTFDTKTLNLQSLLKLVSVAGGKIGKLEKETNQNFGFQYRWMKDNKTLAYINFQGIQNLFSYTMDGSKPKQLTNFNSGNILNFDFSYDGKKIYIVRGIINSDLILIKDNKGIS